jgi:GNAT superfamily N-acetyltransferase
MVVSIRLGVATDVDAAVSVYERSSLAYHQGDWPNRPVGVARVVARLCDPSSWFLVADEGSELVGMASAEPLRSDERTGSELPGGCFLSYLFVVPDRWGQGIGGALLDAALHDARLRGYRRMHLWTEDDNERSHRLYRSRGFAKTGSPLSHEDTSEWARRL